MKRESLVSCGGMQGLFFYPQVIETCQGPMALFRTRIVTANNIGSKSITSSGDFLYLKINGAKTASEYFNNSVEKIIK